MRFHKPHDEFDYPSAIEFQNKIFHLSAKFNGCTKEDFAETITDFGGECRGFGSKKHLNIRETDYLIIGDDGYRTEDHGDKFTKIRNHNTKNPDHKILIIKQSHCMDLIGKMQPPKP
jgi:hypothetical protein